MSTPDPAAVDALARILCDRFHGTGTWDYSDAQHLLWREMVAELLSPDGVQAMLDALVANGTLTRGTSDRLIEVQS